MESTPLVAAAAAQQQGASEASAVVNLVNTILGTGILAMSSAVADAGLYPFVAAMLFTVLLAHWAVEVLFETVEALGVQHLHEASYQALGRRLLGRGGERLGFWSVTLQQLGAVTAYVVIVGDVLTPVFAAHGVARWQIQVLVLLVFIFPLCLLRTMDSLRHYSFVAVVAMTSFVVFVLARGAQAEAAAPGVELWPDSASHVLRALPLISFAFLCHQNTFPIYSELNPASRNVAGMRRISLLSMGAAFVTYMAVGLAGYLLFGADTQGDLMLNFAASPTLMGVRLLFGFGLCLSYPVVLFEARHNLQHALFGRQHTLPPATHVLFNAALVGSTSLVGILAPNVTSVIGLIGSTCSPVMVFVLPGALALKAGVGGRRAAVLLGYGSLLIPACVVAWGQQNL